MKRAEAFHGAWAWPKRPRRTPTVLQMEAVECGAACLCMILAHYGRHVTLEELRIACGVSRDGSKASNLLRAARRYGLDARGLKLEPSQLRMQAAPLILHWNFNHFVVLDGFRRGMAYLNDPAHGPTVVSESEVDEAFTGIALSFTPSAAFRQGGRRPNASRLLIGRLKGARAGVVFAVLVGIALVVPGLLVPAFAKIFVDEILVQGLADWVRPLLWAMSMTALFMGATALLQQEYLLRLETRLSACESSRFFWHILRLPIQFFSQRYGGEVGSRVATNDRIAQVLSGEVATAAIGAVMIGFYGILMMRYDWMLTLVGVAAAGLNIGCLRWVSRARRDANQRLLQERGKMVGAAMGGLQTIETLKASGGEPEFFARWAGHHAKTLNAQQQLGLTTQFLHVMPAAVMAITGAIVLGAGAARVVEGEMSMGALVAFQGLLTAFLQPTNRLVGLGGSLQEMYGDLRRVEDVLNASPEARSVHVREDRQEGTERSVLMKPRLEGHLCIRNLVFGYNPLDSPLIASFELTVEPGEHVALVGGSGSGKSTIARLVCGLLTPWEGEILFDGIERANIDKRLLSNSVAYVDQDVLLFEGTIRENLTLWDETIPEAVVVRAAKDGCIHDMIAARPEGYGGHVEEGGRNVSGGQRQRMEIARALTLRPTLLVMDEATSALDADTEQRVTENLRLRGCTCLVVAHRLSAVRDCDRILVMDSGAVVEEGTHYALVQRTGLYRRLMEHQ